jgi:hypothetical protein
MKPRAHIVFCVIALLAAACSKIDRNLLPNQRTSFERYLNGKDYVIQDGVYKFVVNAQRDGFQAEPVVEWGDSVIFNFAEYVFASAPAKLAATNIFALVQSDTTINTAYWSFDPARVELGDSPMLEGLKRGLPGCHRGDSVVLLLSSDLAYGTKNVGPVAGNTAVMLSLNILTVK